MSNPGFPPYPPFHQHPPLFAHPPPGPPYPIPVDPRLYPLVHLQPPQLNGGHPNDPNTWYHHPPPPPPLQIHGPFISPTNQTPPPLSVQPSPVTPSEQHHHPPIHDYWKGRIVAPVAVSSIPQHVTLNARQSAVVLKPAQAAPRPQNGLRLLPPRSYGANLPFNKPSPNTESNGDKHSDEVQPQVLTLQSHRC
jgi:hypothetical protein